MRMFKNLALSLSLFGIIATGAFVGCAKKSDSKTESKTEAAPPADAVGLVLKDLPKDDQEALSKLSADDLKLALAQEKCPVGGQLGSMGKPIKVMVKGQAVFVCCKGCVDPLKADPDKYLAMLKKKK